MSASPTAPSASSSASTPSVPGTLFDALDTTPDLGVFETARLTEALFTSRTDEWYTPPALVEVLARRHSTEGRFVLDAAANAKSTKAPVWFDQDDDALSKDWHATAVELGGGTVWCNPPYSDVESFVAKAAATARAGTPVVCLVPARLDTAWWHDHAMTAHTIEVIRGRLTFHTEAGVPAENSAPFPSVVLIFRPGYHCVPKFVAIGRDGHPTSRQDLLPGM